MMKYIPGRSNLAVTIYVPWDCPNHCPFCTSKKDYADTSNFSLDAIIQGLYNFRNIGYIKDVVITGGEPFANLPSLSKLVNAIDRILPHCKIFINTTLPTKNNKERDAIIDFLETHRIDCLNISRHMHFTTKLENYEFLKRVAHTVNVRINSVIMGVEADYNPGIINKFIQKYYFANKISFRGDYTKIKNQNDLRGMNDRFLQALFQIDLLSYNHSGGCLVCNDDSFTGLLVDVSYHRGLEESLVTINNETLVINDIIIHQDGSITLDWGGKCKWNDDILHQWLEKSYIEEPSCRRIAEYDVFYPVNPNGDSMSSGLYSHCGESYNPYRSCGESYSSCGSSGCGESYNPYRSCGESYNSCGGGYGSCGSGGYGGSCG